MDGRYAEGRCTNVVVCHGDTDDKPKPVPSINRIKERVAVAAPPATMAPDDTALASVRMFSG
jgi:hypothetical protein